MDILKLFRSEGQRAKKLTDFLVTSPVRCKKIGTTYGGWCIPEGFLDKDSICYCLGAGEDVSFDLGLINLYNCRVVSVDPTPRAISHHNDIINSVKLGVSFPIVSGRNSEVYYKVNKEYLKRWSFIPCGVWSSEMLMKFFTPKNPESVSHSIVNLQNTDQYFEASCNTIKGIMESCGDYRIDLLKMDIEGAEHEVIRSMLSDGLFPDLLLIEFDQPCDFSLIEGTLKKLHDYDYELHAVDKWNVTFLRK